MLNQLAGAIFIAVLTVQTSLAATLDEFLAYFKYDVTLNFTQARRIDQMRREGTVFRAGVMVSCKKK